MLFIVAIFSIIVDYLFIEFMAVIYKLVSGFPLYALVKLTRDSQKISSTSGRSAGTNPTAAPRDAAGKACYCPRKKEPVAIKNEKHVRQRCRLTGFAPNAPPRSRASRRKYAPDRPCRLSPFPNDIAAVPDSKAVRPAQI